MSNQFKTIGWRILGFILCIVSGGLLYLLIQPLTPENGVPRIVKLFACLIGLIALAGVWIAVEERARFAWRSYLAIAVLSALFVVCVLLVFLPRQFLGL
jgi:hypothetical protein